MTSGLLGVIDTSSVPALVILAECFLLLFIGKMVFDISTPQFRVARQLGQEKNTALGVTMAMYYLALAIVVSGVVGDGSLSSLAYAPPPSATSPADAGAAATTAPAVTKPAVDWSGLPGALTDVAIWGVAGILLLGVARVSNDRLILSHFDTTKEIIQDKNVGTGVVEGAAYVASAFIIRASVIGEGSAGIGEGLGLTVLFFALSQIMLAVFTIVYQRVTAYDLHAEIERDNIAVGVAMAGQLVALGIVLGAGQQLAIGDTVAWQVLSFVVVSLIAIVLLVIFNYLTNWMILTKIDLDKEVSTNQNVAVACVAGAIPIALASFVAACWAG